jgi:hypothetical protein
MATTQVVTWQAPNGEIISLCDRHTGANPRNSRGEEYCTVQRGRHKGLCDLCARKPGRCPVEDRSLPDIQRYLLPCSCGKHCDHGVARARCALCVRGTDSNGPNVDAFTRATVKKLAES